ncbi:heavy-metal-associated domain-containing protein [Anaerosalibacter bizertensis]|uniref:Heavy-metal-associated domain-containing protein n=1 Tax=Anaerosalibacter bizertensis TaxID=932217 RepID=A0A844FEQ9_9FIRM|nr:heavy-metal-associated domain-containing protein [Anaerosalibacter bizertensis]
MIKLFNGGDILKVKKFVSQSFGRVDENYIKNSLHSIEGVKAVRLDDSANTITVEYDDSKVSPSTLESELKKNNFL